MIWSFLPVLQLEFRSEKVKNNIRNSSTSIFQSKFLSEKQRTTEIFNNSDQDSARNSVRYSARKNIPLHLFLIENIFSIYLGNPFTELTSENKKFTLLMEQNDVVLIGHLVLYHIFGCSRPPSKHSIVAFRLLD